MLCAACAWDVKYAKLGNRPLYVKGDCPHLDCENAGPDTKARHGRAVQRRQVHVTKKGEPVWLWVPREEA